MREKKFKAWDKKWKRWIDSDDVTLYGDGTGFAERRSEDGGDVIEAVDLPSKEIEVVESTGHKDKNLNAIFEGHILYGKWGNLAFDNYEVRWRQDDCGFEPFVDYDSDCGMAFQTNTCEIVGNIFENPELIKT